MGEFVVQLARLTFGLMTSRTSAEVHGGSRYWRGYPAECRAKLPGVLASLGCSFLLLVLLPVVGAAGWFASDAPLLKQVVFGGTLSVVATWCAFAYFKPRSVLQISVLPYFERQVGGTDTFLAGKALARNWERVDALARELGFNHLSDFGFADDLEGDLLTWHDSGSGYDVVNTISERIALELTMRVNWSRSSQYDADLGLLQDLEVLANALSRAADQGIRFSFLIRIGGSVSPMEMARRAGSFF